MILVAVVYPVECYSRNEPCELSLISTFLLLSLGRYLSFHWKLHCSRHDIAEKLLRWRKPIIHSLTHSLDTFTGKLLVLDDIIRRVVSVYALTMCFLVCLRILDSNRSQLFESHCMYLKRNRNCLLLQEPGFLGSPDWLVGSMLPIFLLFCVVLCVLFVFVMCPVPNFVLRLVHITIPISLDCPFLIGPSVFSNVCLYVSLDCPLLIVTSVFLTINQYDIIS